MSYVGDPPEELGRLAAALCDGEITAGEAQRLERLARRSPEALRYFLHYVQLEGELHWNTAAGFEHKVRTLYGPPPSARPAGALPGPPTAGRARRKPFDGRIGVAASVAVLVLVGSWAAWSFLGRLPTRQPAPQRIVVASLVRTVNADWPDDASAVSDGSGLAIGEVFRLRDGLAEIRFQSTAEIILEGPARFKFETVNRGFMDFGNLAAKVPPKAAGFTVRTPSATIVDRGTEIGVTVERDGASEVHVFDGEVEVRPATRPGGQTSKREVAAGKAIRVSLRPGAASRVLDIPIKRDFVRALPALNSVGRLRRLVAAHPHLIHHYTFEGNTRWEMCRDKRGSLGLTEVEMVGGTGGGDVYELAPGFDGTSNAMRLYRSPQAGDTAGVGLESERAFEPGRRMTVELLLKLERLAGPTGGVIAAAIALQTDPREAGFLGVAVERDRFAWCIREGRPRSPTELRLVPKDWYYVATTFEADGGQATVNGCVANLSRGDRELSWVVENAIVDGVPSSGRLGIGKGFGQNSAHSYPWPGVLDEIAIYDEVLGADTLEAHLQVLVEGE